MQRFSARLSGGIAVAVLSLMLVGCQSPASSGTKAPVKYTGTLPTPSPYRVNQITSGGDYVHSFTGLVFPDSVGPLQRLAVVEGTENKDDVGATYAIPGRQDFIVSALVFPIWNVVDHPMTVDDVPAGCEQGYTDAKSIAQGRLYNARIVREGPIAAPRFRDAVFTRMVAFDADGGERLADFPIRSELYVQCGVRQVWVVQYRVTYAPGFDGGAALAETFMKAVPAQP